MSLRTTTISSPGVRADLLHRLGHHTEAGREFARAAELADNAAERRFLLRRSAESTALGSTSGPAGPGTLGPAIRDFPGRDDLGPAAVRSHGQTLHRLRRTSVTGTPSPSRAPPPPWRGPSRPAGPQARRPP